MSRNLAISIKPTQGIWERATLQDDLIFQYQTERMEVKLFWWQESLEDAGPC